MILCADIGGTRARLAVFSWDGPLRPRHLRIYPSREFSGLGELLRTYFQETRVQPEWGVLSLAGPVLGRHVHLTNLGWKVSASRIERRLGLKRVFLLNDLEAKAYGLPVLSGKHLKVLHPGRPSRARVSAVLAPGTGLGEALLVRLEREFLALPTEGGHADFPADTEEEWRVYQEARRRFGHASLERILSGPGLSFLYEALTGEAGLSPEEILARARKRAPAAERTVRIFVRILAREAGNLALKSLALGGIFLGGGLSPALWPWLVEEFIPSFVAKGRLEPLLRRIPVKVITHPYPALLGAAAFARQKGSPPPGSPAHSRKDT